MANSSKTLAVIEHWIIKADSLTYLLHDTNTGQYYYYPTIDHVFTELLNLKIKSLAGADNRHNIESLGEAVIEANKWIKDVVGKVTNYKV